MCVCILSAHWFTPRRSFQAQDMARLVALFMCILCVQAYNIDTKFPIVYSDSSSTQGRSSYFGYSIILQANVDNPSKNWIQIGAPRGNYSTRPRVKEPGVVYRCPVSLPCRPLPLEDYDIDRYIDNKEGAWIGGAMDIQAPDDGGRSVVCGHRWKQDDKRRGSTTIKYRDMLGICYWMKEDFQVTSSNEYITAIVKLNEPSRRLFNLTDTLKAYDWAVGQMGSSVHFPSHKDDEVVLGAPGLLNWEGNAINCRGGPILSGGGNQKRAARLTEFDICTIPSIAYDARRKQDYFTYMGYSVSSGRFLSRDQLLYVSGGPRAESFRGKVLLYYLPMDVNERSNVKEMAVGSAIGEYFGASLAVGDFTGDGLDDLVVGAPLYTRNHDEGCIYIYYGNDKGTLMQGSGSEVRISGRSPGARFGSTVMALGDIDQDGFGDLAVGAPYEDDNRGAVYIFSGGVDGLDTEYSQRIAAEEVSPQLRGFGISIARPADVDGNLYTDVAVGSYISGHAVLLRGRPIVTLTHMLYTKGNRVERNATQFGIRVCSQYTGSNVSPQLDILRTLVVDERFERAFIRSKEFKQSEHGYTNSVKLGAGIMKCDEVTIHIHKEKMNLTDPLEIKIFQEVKNKIPEKGGVIWINTTSSTAVKDGFCKFCPMRSRKNANIPNSLIVNFDLDCGPDNICHSELLLQCYFKPTTTPSVTEPPKSYYNLGSNKNMLELHMDVTNKGELAYSTELEVTIPSPVHLFRIPTNCQINLVGNTTKLKCDIANPLNQNAKGELTLGLDMSAVKGESGQLDFIVAATTSSEDLNVNKNTQRLPLVVVTDASMTLAGKSINDTYSYVELSTNSSSKSIYFFHVYQVQKVGASPVEEALIEMMIPTSVWNEDRTKQIHFLGMYEPEGKINEAEIRCSSDYTNTMSYLTNEKQDDMLQFSDDAIVDDAIVDNEVDREKREVGGVKCSGGVACSAGREKRQDKELEVEGGDKEVEEVGGAKYLLPANRTMFLNCSDEGVVCSRVWCKAGRFLGSAVARVKLRMVLNITMLEPLLGKKDIILFTSRGLVNIVDNIKGKRPAHAGAFTTFLGSVSDKKVNDWVIPLSIGIGLLLLFVTIMLLIKTGFFERKKKEELEALKSAEVEADMTVHSNLQQLEENDGQPSEIFEFE